MWELWLGHPSPDVWDALSRWRRPATSDPASLVALGEPAPPDDVVAAVARAGHPIADIALATVLAGRRDLVEALCATALSTADRHLTGICLEHHLAPEDPRQAAMFFLLTGQRERYRLADPDHWLLAITYQGAGEDDRDRIRAAIAGEPDLVRVLADAIRRDRTAGMSHRETEYVVDAFARRGDWPALWALARDLPAPDAVDAAGRIRDWRPGPADAALFDVLAGADVEDVRAACEALEEARSALFTVPRTPVACSFSPDGRQFAVAYEDVVHLHTLPVPSDEPTRSRAGRGIRAVLFLDDEVVMTAGADTDRLRTGFIEWDHGDGTVTREVVAGEVTALARRPDGFAALTEIGGNAWLHVRDGGRVPRTMSVRDGLEPDSPDAEWTLVVDGARLAVAGVRLSFPDPTGTCLVPAVRQYTTGRDVNVTFAGPTRLVAVDDTAVVRVWRETGDGVWRVAAERQLELPDGGGLPRPRVWLAYVPLTDEVAVFVDDEPALYLNATTLADVMDDRPYMCDEVTCLAVSPDGTRLLVGGPGFFEVADVGAAVLSALVERPLCATTPTDLRVLNTELARAASDEPTRPVLDVLRACLEHRFGAEVALGSAGPTAVGRDEIALGGSAQER